MSSGPEVGDWVQVWGQVVDGKVHPEDALVEFFSHSEQYNAHVRRDRINVPAASNGMPPFITQCTALRQKRKGALMRCVRHESHGDLHKDAKGKQWDHLQVAGYFEDH